MMPQHCVSVKVYVCMPPHLLAWQNRLETALHDKEQELGRPLTAAEEADLRRQAASPNNRQRSKSRNATLFRFTRGEIGVDTVLEEVVEDSISRDMERTGRGMPFYVDSIRQMEKELGKEGAFLADKPSYTKQDIIEAVGKMVRGKVLADTAKPNNGLSDWVNDFLSLVRKWVNEVVAMVKLGDAVNKVLSDPKARERLGDEFVNMVEDLAHQNTEFMRGLQRDATLRYTMEAATRKPNPTPTLTEAMEKHGAQVRKETEEREQRHKALSDDIAAANAIMDGEEPAAPQEPAAPAEMKQEPAHPVDELTQDEETRAWGKAIYNKARSDRGRRKALDMVRIAPQLRESGVDVTTEAGAQKAENMAEYAARCREQLEARAQKPLDEETQARGLATLMGWERWHELGELVDEAAAWDGKKRVIPKLIEAPKEGTDFSAAVRTPKDEYTQEERGIVARAQNDGTYMKAPNGKPSKLAPKQWAQVRTKAFREFFGDWETLAKIKTLLSVPAMKVTPHEPLEKKAVKEVFRSLGEVRNSRNGRKVKFPTGSAGKIVGHQGFDTSSIVRQFGELFESSVKILSEEEVIKEGHKTHNNHEIYEHYVNKFAVGKDEYFVRFTVPVVRKSEEAHVHSSAISSVQIYKAENSTLYPSSASGSSSSPLVDKKLASFFASVNEKDVSKVLDENGEPLVVYHGTTAEFNSFDKRRIRKRQDGVRGFYFTPRRATSNYYAHGWSTPEDIGGLMQCFLCIKNPLVDVRGEKANNALEVAQDDGKLGDHDGIIAVEQEGDTQNAVEIVAFEPTQIKSATDNRGTFDANDADITYALRFSDSSTTSHGALSAGRMAFAQTIAENVSKMLAEEIDRFRSFDGKVRGSREKALVAIGAVYNMARSVSMLMPAGYRVNVHPYMKQLQVFAEMAATGDLDLTADMASQKVRNLDEMQGRMADWQGGVDALVQEYGNAKVNEVLAKILGKVGDSLTKMERDAAVAAIQKLFERLAPKKDPKTGKLQRGVMKTEGYEEMAQIADAMQLDAESLDKKLAEIEAGIAKAEQNEDEAEILRLQGQHILYSTFGNLADMNIAGVMEAYRSLQERVRWNRWAWDEVLAGRRHAQRKMIEETVAGVGGRPSLNKVKEERERKKIAKRLRHAVDSLMSYPQAMTVLKKVGAGKLADSLSKRLNKSMEDIKTADRERWIKIDAVSRQTLGKSWTRCMNMLHEKHDTGIPFEQRTYGTATVSRAYAAELVAMTPAQRAEEWKKNEAMGGVMAQERYSEEAVEAMREELAKGGASQTIKIRYVKEVQTEKSLTLTKGQGMATATSRLGRRAVSLRSSSLVEPEGTQHAQKNPRKVVSVISLGLHAFEHAEGFCKFVCGFELLQAREAFIGEDVVVVAGQHELLPADFHLADVAAARQNLDFVVGEQVAHLTRQLAEAVNPLALQRVCLICGAGARQLRVGVHAQAGGVHIGRRYVGADEVFSGVCPRGHGCFTDAEEVRLHRGFRPDGGHLALKPLNALAQQLAVEFKADGGDVPALLGAEQVAGAADFQVAHGDFEAAAECCELLDGGHAAAGISRDQGFARQQKVGVGAVAAAPHAAAQLVQICQPEAVCAVNDDGVGVGNVNAAFNDGGGEQDVCFSCHEVAHDELKLALVHLPVANNNAGVGHELVQPCLHLPDALHAVVQEEDLPAARHFSLNGLGDELLAVGGHRRLHGQAVEGGGIDGAHVARAHERYIERARDGRGGEGEHVHHAEHALELLLVAHAEALLLVDDGKPQILEDNVF